MFNDLDSPITALLRRWNGGDSRAVEELLPLVYRELRYLAGARIHRSLHQAISPTELVHEAYLRMSRQVDPGWRDRKHFYAVASTLMRRALVDAWRRTHAGKRTPSLLFEIREQEKERYEEVRFDALDEALVHLEHLDPLQGKVVELRFFGGFTIEQTAEILDVSITTVKRQWASARAFLHRELSRAVL